MLGPKKANQMRYIFSTDALLLGLVKKEFYWKVGDTAAKEAACTADGFQRQVAQTVTFLVLSLRSPFCSKIHFSTFFTPFVRKASNSKYFVSSFWAM